MEKLKIVEDGKIKKVEITHKIAKGIFYVEGKAVKRNCEVLNINFIGSASNEISQQVTKIGSVGILSINFSNDYYQYILKDYAEKEEIEELISRIPKESKEAFRQAYNLTKMNTMQDLDFLGGKLGDVN